MQYYCLYRFLFVRAVYTTWNKLIVLHFILLTCLLWTFQRRRSVTSTGLRNAQRAISTSLSTRWPSTICRSTYCVSSKSPMHGSVSFVNPECYQSIIITANVVERRGAIVFVTHCLSSLELRNTYLHLAVSSCGPFSWQWAAGFASVHDR